VRYERDHGPVGRLRCHLRFCDSADAVPLRITGAAALSCDVIVWLDLRKGIYYAKRQRWYGRGFTGSFVCQEEARAGGYRRSLLGLR
jgi:hypothetical protein